MSDDLAHHIERLTRQQAAIVALARRTMGATGDVQTELGELCRAGAVTLGVERTSVWMLSRDRSDLRCTTLYELSRDVHTSGSILHATECPRYFAALESGRAIAASDARADPRTSEFAENYLGPLGITSMMDAAIRDQGTVSGAVCLEHVGPMRQWRQDEIAFAGALADQAALLFAAAERRRLEDERERVRQQLVHTQKLESLGVLAAGAAQEFEGLLVLVLGNTALAREMIGPEHRACEPLQEVQTAAEHATRLTRQLLAYSGKSRVVTEPVDLSAQVAELSDLVQSSCPRRVRVRFELARDLSGIKADPMHLQQAVMNLVVNGIEAIGHGPGEVRVSTAMRFLATGELATFHLGKTAPAGRYVMLEVEDTGEGLAPGEVERVFDPFYTTKGPGRGLGLSAVMGIVRNHRGAIDVTDGAAGRTTFRVYFPASDTRPTRPPSLPPSSRPRH